MNNKYKLLVFLTSFFILSLLDGYLGLIDFKGLYETLNISITILFPLIFTLLLSFNFNSIENEDLHEQFLDGRKKLKSLILISFMFFSFLTITYFVEIEWNPEIEFFNQIFSFNVNMIKGYIVVSLYASVTIYDYILILIQLNKWSDVFAEADIELKRKSLKESSEEKIKIEKLLDDNQKLVKKISEIEKLLTKKSTRRKKEEH
jgi:hypothetical protein